MAQYFYVHGIQYKVFAPAEHFIVALGNKTAVPWLK